MVEHDRHQGLHAGHARGAVRIGLGLFFKGVRRMVGAEHVDHALVERRARSFRDDSCRAPAGSFASSCRAGRNRRRESVRWCGVTSTLAISLCWLRKSISSPVETCSTWMRARSRARCAPAAACRSARSRRRARPGCEDGIAARRAGACARRGDIRPRSGRRRGGASGQDRGHALVVGDQQRAGGRAHEDFDAGSAGQAFQLGECPRHCRAWRRPRRRNRNACVRSPARPCRRALRAVVVADWYSAFRTRR